MASSFQITVIFAILFAGSVYAEDVEDLGIGVKSDAMFGLLRAMVNQTKADTLNLPANASSIRENITDTFSCENRTYGYYADVDNDCQIFHVCLPSQTPSGRNTTYRWSFICPNETMFNQEVLTCARPRDSIDCEDSPMYYDRNEEMYKTNDTTSNTQSDQHKQMNNNKEGTTAKTINSRRKTAVNNRKQNLVLENSITDLQEDPRLTVKEESKPNYGDKNFEVIDMNEALMPVMEASEFETKDQEVQDNFPMENGEMATIKRIAGERRLRNGRRIGKRGSFRFKSDA